MRKLKLQMQVSADGMTAAQNGSQYFNWDAEVRQYSISNAQNVDCILLGRKTAAGFIPYWKSVADNSGSADCAFGGLVSAIPKVVFSRTLSRSEWPNATVANGEVAQAVAQLKQQAGKDLLAYGGSSFVSSLINHDLVDEYHLLLNPVLLGTGLSIATGLTNNLRLALVDHKAFSCGTVSLCYKRIPG